MGSGDAKETGQAVNLTTSQVRQLLEFLVAHTAEAKQDCLRLVELTDEYVRVELLDDEGEPVMRRMLFPVCDDD